MNSERATARKGANDGVGIVLGVGMLLALLAFVNRWGRLGVGLPGAEDFGADGVRWTGEGLRELTGWIQALYALQHRQPTPITWTERKDGDAGEPAGAAVLPKYSR